MTGPGEPRIGALSNAEHVESELRGEIERGYRELFGHTHDAIIIFDPRDEQVLEVNDRACELYRIPREAFVGMNMRAVSVDVAAGMQEIGQPSGQRGTTQFQTLQRLADGSELILEVHATQSTFRGRPAILSINRDVTEQVRLADQQRQARRLEALGEMAGGVAHDLNNLLTVVVGYPDLIRFELPAAHPALEYVDAIGEAAARTSEMTRQLLAFSRGHAVVFNEHDLNHVVAEHVPTLREVVGNRGNRANRIEVTLDLHPEPLLISANRSLLEQVLANLAANARDAMPNGGSLAITTSVISDADGHGAPLGLEPGRYALVQVRDTGVGIAAEDRVRIFDPFFSTKGPGPGSGLGLSMVYGAVKQHGGAITVDSTPGRGSSFVIHLPLEPGVEQPRPEAPPAAEIEIRSGTVLIVEDEPMLKLLAAVTLEHAGYHVLVAANAAEAEQVFDANPIDLVVSDVIMPGINGPELLARLRAKRPGLACLFVSGFSAAVVHDEPFLAKPFSPSELTLAVGALLRGPSKP